MQNLQKSSGGTLTHKDLPPDDLLDRWSIKPPPPPRGRTGPYPQHEPSPTTQTQDQTALLVATLAAVVTDSLARRQSSPPKSPSKRSQEAPSAPLTPKHPLKRSREESSPSPSSKHPSKRPRGTPSPPPVGEELKVFLEDCVKKTQIPQDVMDKVFCILHEQMYTVDGLGHATLDQGKIAKLTGLPDGAVISIHALTEKWLKKRMSSGH